MRRFFRKHLAFAAVFLLMAAVGLSADMSLDELLELLGPDTSLSWDPLFETGVFECGPRRAAFETNTGEECFVIIDRESVLRLPSPYSAEGGELRFPDAFAFVLANLLAGENARPSGSEKPFRVAAIIVDPGHGGKDPGAVATLEIDGKKQRVEEKDITLNVAKLLYSELRQAWPDKKILITRERDTFPALEERAAIANKALVGLGENEAIIFVSIHANSSKKANARGFEVWYLSPEVRRDVLVKNAMDTPPEIKKIFNSMLEEEYTTESILIANAIAKRLSSSFGVKLPNRGVKAENFSVTRNSKMPAVLVELGFVTNPEDVSLMTDSRSAAQFAQAIRDGLADFITNFERSGGFTAGP